MRSVSWWVAAVALAGCGGDVVLPMEDTDAGTGFSDSDSPPGVTTSSPPSPGTTASPTTASPTTSPDTFDDTSDVDSSDPPPPMTSTSFTTSGPDTDTATSSEETTDEGTTDEGTTGSTDEGTTDEGTTGTTDEGTTGSTDEGTTTGDPFGCVELDIGSSVGTAVATGSNVGAGDDLPQSCADSNGPDVVHQWTAPATGTWTFDTAGSSYDTALTLWTSCSAMSDFACDDDDGPGLTSAIVVDLEEDETILVVVEGWGNSQGSYQLNIDGPPVGGSSTDGGSTDGGSTDGGSTDGGSTDSESSDSGSTGDPLDAFETPQPFGDNVTETDLIGVWYLPTDGSSPGYSMSLDIDAMGNFIWTELDGSCTLVREGTGVLWVAGAQLVMLFETFTGDAPWPVQAQFGWDADAPFLIRAGYAPVLGHIAVTITPEMRIATPWSSYGYARTVGGATADDVWVAETELWDVAPGDMTADIVARDRYTLDISGGGVATRTYNRWWYENGVQTSEPPVVDNPAYSDNGVGTLDLAGDTYVYVGSRMASYEPGDNFQLGAPTACP